MAAVVELVEDVESISLILDHIPGLPLSEIASEGGVPLRDFLDIAVSLAGSVSALHELGTVHGGIRPAAVFWDGISRCATLTGFERGWHAGEEGGVEGLPDVADEVLRYVGPELTGRTSLRVDHRADLYGLGALFYQLLTGAAPFGAGDRADVVHAILARKPWLLLGKFDQFSRATPYGAFVEATEGLVHRIPGAPEDEFARWGGRLRDALGSNAALMAGLIRWG